MSLGIEFLDTGMSYIQQALQFVRDALHKVADIIPMGDPNLIITILFLLTSLWLGHFVAKRFVTQPFSMGYLLWTLVISISIFLNLMYL